MAVSRLATLIGGRGSIGRQLHARLLGDGWRCFVPGRDDPQLWQRDLGHVFYCAGLTADYAARPFDTVEAHTTLLGRVLREAQFDSLVYLSSTRLYDSLGDVAATEDRPLALDPANPRHLYDLSKALGESLCGAAGRGRARVARLSCVWGDPAEGAGFLPALMRSLLAARAVAGGAARPRVEVDSSPLFARDYVHIDDVLDALVALATQGEQLIYNVAGGRNVANAQLFERLSVASGCEIVPTHRRDAPAPPRVSIARIGAEFGWRPASVLDRAARLVEQEAACSSS